MRAADPGGTAPRGPVARARTRHPRFCGDRSFSGAARTKMPRRLHEGLGRHRIVGIEPGRDVRSAKASAERRGALAQRSACAAGGARRAEGSHCARVRRGPRHVGSGRGVHRRGVEPATAPQADAVRWAPPPRCRPLDVRSRGARVGPRPAGARGVRTVAMSESFVDLVDLAAERLGAAVVDCNDEFFAPKEHLIKQAPAVWREGEYTERGKWMDGWETRRRRSSTGLGPEDSDHDWCIIRLGVPGIVRGFDVDTAFFKGNFPASCAVDALRQAQGKPDVGHHFSGADWREILPRSPLKGDSHNLFPIADAPAATHLRLRIFPDGGVARLRAYGDVVADWDRLRKRGDVDLAAAEHGGIVVAGS